MDIIAHSLWTYVVAGKQRSSKLLPWLLVFSALPDLIWLPATAYWLFTEGVLRFSMPLYDISHSLVVWIVATVLAMVYHRKAYVVMWPWALHILIDIPGHLGDIHTPVFWPLSKFTFPGWWNWLSPQLLLANYVVITFVIAGIALRNRDYRLHKKSNY